MTQFGYARVSTKGQSLADQINQLKSAGADKILAEKFTGTTTSRPQFDKLIKLVKPGDTITVTKLDRLARNTREALNVLDPLMNNGIKFNVLNIGILENSTIGKLVKTILLAVAEMERDMIVDRTQEGKRYAKLHKTDYHEGRPKRLITPPKIRLGLLTFLFLHSNALRTKLKMDNSTSPFLFGLLLL